MGRNKDSLAFDNRIDYEIKIDSHFNSVYKLGYTMIDIHALISGISKAVEQYEPTDDILTESIETLAAVKADEIEADTAEIISDIEDIQGAIIESVTPRTKTAKRSEPVAFPTTSRKFNKGYEDLLEIHSFKEGSLILDVTSTVLSGIILKFIEKYFFNENNNRKPVNVNVVNNTMIIVNDQNKSKRLIDKDDAERLYPLLLLNEEKAYEIEHYLDDLIARVPVVANDLEMSVKGLLNTLAHEGFIKQQVLYDRKCVKTIVNDVQRFAGNIGFNALA